MKKEGEDNAVVCAVLCDCVRVCVGPGTASGPGAELKHLFKG